MFPPVYVFVSIRYAATDANKGANLLAFPSTYLVECGFSKAAALTKSRNRMDAATRGDLRLSLSNLQPDIMKLAKKCQPQGSH
ncbi:hypothetical protein M513_09479 [Trichuris suis]|uniref:HAT C-terminal dimerisation domain-containing protein n=1 Tax=Trichuris suis TaxID=68888 RepID=A0A085LXF1_9BILA|nr:hypothetical protein M513_09479 [Trichuris suis]